MAFILKKAYFNRFSNRLNRPKKTTIIFLMDSIIPGYDARGFGPRNIGPGIQVPDISLETFHISFFNESNKALVQTIFIL